MSCLSAKTSKNLSKPCAAPVSGVRPIFYLGFLSQLVSAPPRATGDNKTITALVLNAGEKLTKIEGFKTSNNFTTGFNATEFANYLPHTAVFTVFDQSSSGLLQVDVLANVTDAFIITKQNGAAGAWRCIGINTGLTTTAVSAGFNDPTGGAHNITLEAAQETGTMEIFKHMTASVDDTDSYLAGLAFADV